MTRPSLRRRLLATLGAGLAALLVLQAGLSYRATLAEIDHVFDLQMTQVARARAGGDRSFALQEMATGREEDFDLEIHLLPTQVDMQAIAGAADVRTPITIVRGERSLRQVRFRIGHQAFEVVQDLDARREVAIEVAWKSVGIPVLASAALVGALLLVMASLLAPLARLQRDVARRAEDDLTPLSLEGVPSELASLVEETNRLMGRMATAFDAQRSFVADAAHELRTPLAALALQVDVVARAKSPDEREVAIERLRAGITRASHLTSQLLALARSDDSAPRGDGWGAINVRELFDDLVLQRTGLIEQRRLTVAINTLAPLEIRMEPASAHLIFANLLDNALRYTPDGGRIEVVCDTSSESTEITIHDSGPGIAAEERDRVLERFYRSPGALGFGSGLGLSIVSRLVQQLGARLELDTSPLGGLAARVVWPSMASAHEA